MRASHMPKAFWAEHLEQIERREMSIAAYARENDISAGSLYVWRGKLRAERSSVVSQVRFFRDHHQCADPELPPASD